MPDEDNNFDGSLVLDYRKSRGHVRPKNRHCYSDFGTIYGKCLIAWLLVEFANNTASDISKLSSKWYLENSELLRAAIIAKYHVQVMLLFADNGSREIFGNAQCKIGYLYFVAVKKTNACSLHWQQYSYVHSMKREMIDIFFIGEFSTNHWRDTTWKGSIKVIFNHICCSHCSGETETERLT